MGVLNIRLMLRAYDEDFTERSDTAKNQLQHSAVEVRRLIYDDSLTVPVARGASGTGVRRMD